MKAPNLLLRSLLATGSLLLLAGIRHGFSASGDVRIGSATTQLVLSGIGVAVDGLLAGLFLHWCWPRTRSRGAGALVGLISPLLSTLEWPGLPWVFGCRGPRAEWPSSL